MTQKLDKCRLLIYSHDSFGLGHLRRCRTIAHALVDAYKGLSVLIITGSPIIGQFDFKARVDFIRIPGIIKLHNGSYTSLALHIDLEDTLALRESIIHHTARIFNPDIFLVDKEPTGLQGEVLSTLKMLKNTNTRCVLGLRDVMDDPELLEEEWQRKQVWPVLDKLYDELWVYGPENMGSPLEGMPLADSISHKMHYTGYLQRHLPENIDESSIDIPQQPYVLVTSGGGGDGVAMVDWVLRAYEHSPQPQHALVVLGPFMEATRRYDFLARAEKLAQVDMITFSPNMEYLLSGAQAVVAMGGYNTFCEVLSFDKPALIIPRSKPRKEQLIRATKASDIGLVSMIDPESGMDTAQMVAALISLSTQNPPSQRLSTQESYKNYISGLDQVVDYFARQVATNNRPKQPVVLFYVQYLLGVGHVRRSSLIARNMVAQGMEVHVIFGGIPVPQIDFAPAKVHYLPAVKSADAEFSGLVDEHGNVVDDNYKQQRCRQLLELAETIQPDIVLTETYPFGRRMMRFELIPLLEWTTQQSPRPMVVSSIRDILQRRPEKREQEYLQLVGQYYDHVLIHGDPDFTPLESSFPPAQQMADKLGYSGYVCPSAVTRAKKPAGIIVSVGGGSIGHKLLATALELHRSGYANNKHWTVMTGLHMRDDCFNQLQAHSSERFTVIRMATDFVQRLAQAEVSVSLGGYNTTMDLFQTHVPAVIAPFEDNNETEQLARAEMLATAGRIQMVRQEQLTPDNLRQAIDRAISQQATMPVIDIDGAHNSARLLKQWWKTYKNHEPDN